MLHVASFCTCIILVYIATSRHLPYFATTEVDSWTFVAIAGVGLYKVIAVDLCDGTRNFCSRRELPYFWVVLLFVPYILRWACEKVYANPTGMAVVKGCGWAFLCVYIMISFLMSAGNFNSD